MATIEERVAALETQLKGLTTSPTLQEVNAKQVALIASMQLYIDQQRAQDHGSADAVITDPPGQPFPGWYPITDPGGQVGWRPSVARMIADAAGLKVKTAQLNFTPGFEGSNSAYTAKTTDSGWLYYMRGATLTQNCTITLPNGLPVGWNLNLIQLGTGQLRVVAASGATIVNRNSFDATAGQGAPMTIVCAARAGGNSTYVLMGDLKVAA